MMHVENGPLQLRIAVCLLLLLPMWTSCEGRRTLWKDSAGNRWTALRVRLPEGADQILYVYRNVAVPSEYEHGVVFPRTSSFAPLPYIAGGRISVEVFWLGTSEGDGPFLRLQGVSGEYLVDLHKQKTFLIVRAKGRVFAGEVTTHTPEGGNYSISGDGNGVIVYTDGGKAKEITGRTIAETGRQLMVLRE